MKKVTVRLTDIRMTRFQSAKSKFQTAFGDGADPIREVLTGVLSTIYKLDDAKIGEIVKDGASAEEIRTAIVNLDKERVRDLTTTTGTNKYQEGYKKAKGEALTAREQELKAHFGVDSDLQGAELVEFIVAQKAKEAGITDDEAVKKTAAYQALENRLKKEIADVKKTYETQISEIKTNYNREAVFSSIAKTAMEIVTPMNPILPKSATVAETYKNNFLNELKQYDYQVPEGSNKPIVMKDSKVMQDEHGNTIAYEDFVKGIAAKHFEFQANNGGTNGGNGGDGGAGAAKYPAVTKPKNEAELSKLLADRKLSVADRRAISDEYKRRMGNG